MAKSFSWRFVATLTTILLVFVVSGSFSLAISIGLIEVVAKLLVFYLHERAWTISKWGIRDD